MKSLWLRNVVAHLPLKFGVWGYSGPRIRPTLTPNAVPKLFMITFGVCTVSLPCPRIFFDGEKTVVHRGGTFRQMFVRAGRWLLAVFLDDKYIRVVLRGSGRAEVRDDGILALAVYATRNERRAVALWGERRRRLESEPHGYPEYQRHLRLRAGSYR